MKLQKILAEIQNSCTFAASKGFGALAQLARALDWQSKGQGFDSLTLHPNQKRNLLRQGSFFGFLHPIASDHPYHRKTRIPDPAFYKNN